MPASDQFIFFLLFHLGCKYSLNSPVFTDLIAVFPETYGKAAKICCAKGCGLNTLGPNDFRSQHVCLELHQEVVGAGAAVHTQSGKRSLGVLFHRFQEAGKTVFHHPDKKVFYDYIDITKPGLIIKPLVTGSPLQEVGGITVPMLEKLLVDIRSDADFDYMSGGESVRMLENAVSLYTINTTKLLRYAGRRHCREQFEQVLIQLGL